jgi:hypothetical protein
VEAVTGDQHVAVTQHRALLVMEEERKLARTHAFRLL